MRRRRERRELFGAQFVAQPAGRQLHVRECDRLVLRNIAEQARAFDRPIESRFSAWNVSALSIKP